MLRGLFATVALLLTFSCSPKWVDTPETAAVREVFHTYDVALLSNEGSAAADAVAEKSFEYYSEVRDLALYALEEELSELPAFDLMHALILRQQVPADVLRDLTGREVFQLEADEGWIFGSRLGEYEIGSITIVGDEARAEVLEDGWPIGITERAKDGSSHPLSIRLLREAGGWKVNLQEIRMIAYIKVEIAVMIFGDSLIAYVLQRMGEITGTPVDPDIMRTPLEKDLT